MRPEGVNPVLTPQPTSFHCPMRKEQVKWEESDIFNPAATVKDGKIVVLYRAEDNSAQGIGKRTSRIGYAESVDGVTMKRFDSPVLFPGGDDFESIECPGGCEDPRVAMTEDGLIRDALYGVEPEDSPSCGGYLQRLEELDQARSCF